MHATTELLPGAWLISMPCIKDVRGDFTKLPSATRLAEMGLPFELQDQFFTRSKRDVIRGMHFQLPPHDHIKLVSCMRGSVMDVLLDLRTGQEYGRTACVTLSEEDPCLLYLPSGIAHGFRSLSDDSMLLYQTSRPHAPSHDAGVLWSSIGIDWQCTSPILSDRDMHHPAFTDFQSPF